ncbi:hypothetical protein RYX56_05775 [Alkalihalophilus lindianensis]|uniref:Uncharacterized protein n=1 Tax=Alkalihalophilus lindianensis TaxID=1630542 RepID=A0ABU3X977_9BACI|nr:hypothetical protein [Alkalihalophilus lindianensis]MDV2683817.1 hypothetical protein [Alkalihalophilus lindianensis]MDV2683883.1 hypothetical protein [Alkalihalophilus lindianensis]
MNNLLSIAIPTLMTACYIGLVVGTYKKLQNNNIHLIGRAKYFSLFFPLALFLYHFIWAVNSFSKSPKKALSIMGIFILKYPVAVGLLIELMLEDIAHQISNDAEVAKVRKKRAINKQVDKRKLTDISDVPKSIFEEYKTTLRTYAV